MKQKIRGFTNLAKESLYPQEAPVKMISKKESIQFGIPKELQKREMRIALKPIAVKQLVESGHEVYVESKAGELAGFLDQEYSEAGAIISYSHEEVLNCSVILKILPPSVSEIKMIRKGNTLMSAIQAGNCQMEEYLKKINERKITALAYEFIEDKKGGMPFVGALSEIAGSVVIPIAAELLSSTHEGKGIILGGITGVAPTRVLILGSGTVAEYAARAAMGLGAEIRVFDDDIYKLRRLKQSLGREIYTSTLDPRILMNAIVNSDVLISAICFDKNIRKLLITNEMVSTMKKGSVIIDVSIDQGGVIESSREMSLENPSFEEYGVIHYCVPNIASRVPRTASIAISNILISILERAGVEGGIENLIYEKKSVRNGVYAYRGVLTKVNLAQKHKMPFKDIDLFMGARF